MDGFWLPGLKGRSMPKKLPPDSLSLSEFKTYFQRKECPICQSCANKLERFYFWFIIESYYNPNMMEKLKKAQGFCREHTWKLIEAGSPYITGVMYQYLTEDARAKMEECLAKIKSARGKPRRFFRRKRGDRDFQNLKGTFLRLSPCPACASIEENTDRAIGEFLSILEEPGIKPLYKNSGGLCIQHFFRVFSQSDEAKANFLLEDQIERVQKLNGELNRFLESYDYRYPKERKGEEQNSWWQSAEFFAGKKYDPLSLLRRIREGSKLSTLT